MEKKLLSLKQAKVLVKFLHENKVKLVSEWEDGFSEIKTGDELRNYIIRMNLERLSQK